SAALASDRGLDDGLLDVLHRYATTPGPDPHNRGRILVALGVSTHERVVPWLLAALHDPDDQVAAGAAQGLLIHDKQRFRPVVRAQPRIDEWLDGPWNVPLDDDE